MSIGKITEVTASSPTSFEDAIEKGVERASKTLKNVKSAWVQDQQVVVENGKVSAFRVTMKLTFVLED